MFVVHRPLFHFQKRVYLLGPHKLQPNCLELLKFTNLNTRFFSKKNECSKTGTAGTKKLSLKNVNVSGKRVFMRVDFNVPMKEGKITNNQRIVAAIPSIKYALEKKCKSLVLASHLGRPDGKKNKNFSLAPVAKELEKVLGKSVKFLDDCVSDQTLEAVKNPPEGSVFLLENLRFYAEETGSSKGENKKKVKADPKKVKEFRAKLAEMGEVYVNDAFGTAHRPHSSMMGESYKVRASGFLMDKELEYFARVLDNPAKPFLAILGGAKIADKIPLITNLLNNVQSMIIGGGMAFTFLKVYKSMAIGKSLFDKDGSKMVEDIICKAKEKNVKMIFPVDIVIADRMDKPSAVETVHVREGIPNDMMGLDVGKKSNEIFAQAICESKTIVWNGPPGLFEDETFAKGTKSMLDAVVEATKKGATTIVGGGDTATACKKFGGADKVSHVSTGGGASLELLEGKLLPGVAALSDA